MKIDVRYGAETLDLHVRWPDADENYACGHCQADIPTGAELLVVDPSRGAAIHFCSRTCIRAYDR